MNECQVCDIVDVFSSQGFVSGITGIVTKPIKGIIQPLGFHR